MQWTHWAESAEQNKTPIAETLSADLNAARSVLEIGSGTGQHAVHFAQLHSHLQWQPSEHPHNLTALRQNLSSQDLTNISPAIALDADDEQWPALQCDLVYSANTLHIMPWTAVCQLFRNLGTVLAPTQRAFFYGPFAFSDRPLAPSNQHFDRYLHQQNPLSGIRCVDAMGEEAEAGGLFLEKAIEMPANNHILVWQRR